MGLLRADIAEFENAPFICWNVLFLRETSEWHAEQLLAEKYVLPEEMFPTRFAGIPKHPVSPLAVKHPPGVEVGVGVRVGVLVGVLVGVAVLVGVGDETTGVLVGVLVAGLGGVGVCLGVVPGFGVAVGVGCTVGTGVIDTVGLGVAVD